MNPSTRPDPDPTAFQVTKPVPAKSSAVKAGWICLILGFLTFWIFGFGFIFFVATFILAIVAMCTNRLGQGIALLISSVGSTVICFIISILLLSSAFTSALKKERARQIEQRAARVEQHRARVEQGPARAEEEHAISSESHRQDELGPAKRSRIVNLNTASVQELESLPGIGPSRADEIIAHRPYKSVDELSQVKGISQRITDQLRPFVKTDGQTEKLKPSQEKGMGPASVSSPKSPPI
jgi:DNA uptake protein ComE-like DNA-binding protein